MRLGAASEVDDEIRLTRTYFAGEEDYPLLQAATPIWCDRCPVISGPVEKIPGVFKGTSLIKPGSDLQIQANDAMNQGADTLSYRLEPGHHCRPGGGGTLGEPDADLGAIWPAARDKAKVMEFPDIGQAPWQSARIARNEIFQSLSVNSGMIPGRRRGRSETRRWLHKSNRSTF